MSKTSSQYKCLPEDVPPPYNPPAPNTHPMSHLPQSDPQYGYDQRPYGPSTTQTNVVQVQPGGMAGPTTVIVQPQEPIPSMGGHITLSCFVFWCCNPLFGAISFFIAIAGMNASSPSEARSLGKASMWVSVSGILVVVVTAAIILGLYFGGLLYAEKTIGDNVDDFIDDINNNINNEIYSG